MRISATWLYSIFLLAFVQSSLVTASDEVEAFKACINRERNLIYNNTKICQVGKPVDLSGGTEAEGIRKDDTCPVKEYMLSQVATKMADKCRKESFIVDSVTTASADDKKPAMNGEAAQREFIDGGLNLKAPPQWSPTVGTAKKNASGQAPGTRVAKAAAEDSEDDSASATTRKPAATKTTTPTAKKAAAADDGEDAPSNDSQAPSKSTTSDRTDKSQPSKTQADKQSDAKTKDDQTNSDAPTNGQASRSSAGPANVDADLAQCRQAQTKAQTCCGSPASCLTGQDRANYYQLMTGGGGDDEDGLTDACDRLNHASQVSGDLNGKVAALCTNNQYACQNVCAGLVTKYQNLIDSCGDSCDNYSTYQDAIASLQSQQTTCAGYRSKADALTMQTLSSGSDQGLAAACQQRAGSSASLGAASLPSSSAGGGQSVGSSGSPANATTSGGAASGYAATSAAAGRLSGGAATAPGGFQTYDPDLGKGGTYYGQALPGQAANPAGVRTVPNGGGGFGAGAPATSKTAAAGPARPSPGNSIISTDIDQGFRSGGYSAEPGEAPADGPGGPHARRGLASVGDDQLSGYEGMDLKQYLPGGIYYRAGGLDAAGRRSEINGKEEDLFRRVSAKFLEKCKLGVLWRCQDGT